MVECLSPKETIWVRFLVPPQKERVRFPQLPPTGSLRQAKRKMFSKSVIKKITHVFFNALPALFMLALIPLIKNDYNLLIVYIAIIIASFYVKKEKNDILVFIFGFVVMTIFENLFVKTGVETFKRNSLLGVMPLWLPLLWAYGFVAIKRAINVLDGR